MDPLIQVLIPTYERPEYLKEALESVFRQTYTNYRILISDDGKTDRTEKMLHEFFPYNPKIDYRRNPQFNDDTKPYYYAQNKNFLYLKQNMYDEAKYIQWLMDDDLFYPDKFEKMVAAYEQYPDVTLVTSFRHTFGDKYRYANQLTDTLTLHDGYKFGREEITNMVGYCGAPTTVLIKKSTLTHLELGWGRDEGEYIIVDFPRFFDLLSRGNLIYFPQPLSAMRSHPGRDTNQSDTPFRARICWLINLRYAINNKIFLDDLESQKKALLSWLQIALKLEKEHRSANYSSVMFSRFQKLIPHVFEAVKTDCKLDLDPILFPKE